MATILIVVIVLALIFDYINGFHDAANSIATIVSTKVLTPFQAVVWAAFFNFVAFFIFSDHAVANTVAKTVKPEVVSGTGGIIIILSGLIASIIWNLFTWWFGLPSSSSHTLIGGFAGAAIAAAGFNSIDTAMIMKTVIFIFLAPLIGMFISIFITLVTIQKNFWLKIAIIAAVVSACMLFIPFKKEFEKWALLGLSVVFVTAYFINYFRGETAARTGRMFKRLQLVSSAVFSIGHGGADAQKVMGIITAALIAGGNISEFSQMPDWVPLACYTAIGIGTMSGGWKIVKTMGTKITKVTPLEGVCAETAGAITLFTATNLGAPVSTTHTITGSIIGVGATKRLSAVRWGVTVNLIWAWILTIPVSALLASGTYCLIKFFM
ncbi:MAG: inorganic phosphate transporter [Chitinophagaceae bacterium]|jgi:PiT family inorganic phosphate transporter|nr:inorganic phosphate transporter [Chitinophagaceae bacterium]MBP6047076.1 inorganic phosphate transporter [Ferruginibacter sp.]NMD29174.1 inorganic phosphate transporter [Bacteroidota bacterium]MBK7345673.1 inorganic phosphate transporter [Chitinophagaceae bacterium]MBK8774198.1 inorganic phosphate transporter [Chitinophagaceae bacterium]